VEGATILTDGASTARVAPDGRRIDLAVAPASLADRHTLEHVLALVALVVALRRFGLFHLHAAVLAEPDGRAILVAGGAGSGKSTLTLALLEASPGLAWLGDDTALLSARPGGLAVLGFPRPFHLSGTTAAAFPRLGSLLGAPCGSGAKRRLEGRLAFPGRQRLEASAPSLVILPEVVARPTSVVEAVPGAEALGALIESAALVVVDGMPAVDAQLALLAATAGGATCLRARLGRDLLERPGEVAGRLLAGVPRPPG
jgi:hypothetical protein